MQIFWGTSEQPEVNRGIAQFVASHIKGCERGFSEPYKTMGMIIGDRLIGGVVFHDWQPEAGIIELSGASTDRRWIPRSALWPMFSYVFDQVGCQAAMMRVSATNQMENGRGLHRFLKAYGFIEHRIPRLYGRDEDGSVFVLYDDLWRANAFHRENKRTA